MNKLCRSEVFTENKLFATLDPTARKLDLPDGREALLVDTVGFIRKLPHDLVDAFKSTLEEAVYSDILLHIVDCSDQDAETHMEVGRNILEELGAMNKPVLLVLNKIDLVDRQRWLPFAAVGEKVFEVSAETGEGLDKLLIAISKLIPVQNVEINLLAPYTQGWILPFIHENGEVQSSEYTESGIIIKASIEKLNAERLKEYVIPTM
jgi:GTP-binding protein HflX